MINHHADIELAMPHINPTNSNKRTRNCNIKRMLVFIFIITFFLLMFLITRTTNTSYTNKMKVYKADSWIAAKIPPCNFKQDGIRLRGSLTKY